MSWNLQIVPKGLLLSRYIKNVILLNPNNVKNVENNPLILDQYQTYNAANNTANIVFQLAVYNTNPQNQASEPTITSINFIQISNDPLFNEVYYLIPAKFSQAYNLQTDYVVDLSAYSFTQTALPVSQSVTFTESSGAGNISIKNWALSGSSGAKKVYFSINANLSDGTNATYPEGLDVYDEIIVCSSFISSPGVPQTLAKSKQNYSSSPLYFEAEVASNSGINQIDDYGVASYFWDGLILKTTDNVYRNNYSQENIQLFNSISPKASNLNQEKLPVVFSTTLTTTNWSSSAYKKYITANAFTLTASDNVYFFECYVNNYSNTLNYVSGKSFFYEFNIVNSTGSTKYLRQQLVFDEQFNTLVIYISIDDTTWSSDSSYVPSALYKTITITNPDVIGQITQSGSFITFIELLDSANKILQSKIIFKPQNSTDSFVVSETLFTSNSFNLANAYGEFRFFLQNSTYTTVLESVQYGLCQGAISAVVMPNDKIITDYSSKVENSIYNFNNSAKLNTWFTISNSPASGVVNTTTSTVQLFNNQENDGINNLSAVEIQSSVPTFSVDSTLISRFRISSANSAVLKTAYSFDSNLNYENFVFNDLLQTSSGVYLPQNNALYEYTTSLSWAGSNRFDLNVFNVGLGQTCSITTTKTNNLFFYSQSNNSGTLTPPTIIKTVSNISSTNIFNAWISTNGISTAFIVQNSLSVKNKGLVPITITSSAGLSTILPGQPFVNSISTNSLQPTQIIVSAPSSSISNSLNFLYDFGKIGTITDLSLKIQIATPPECPSTLPSFQYSVEVSDDFINWTFVSSLTATDTFYPSTGDLLLSFSDIDQENVRYARVRLYYNIAVTFDPRTIYRYSSLQGTISSSSSITNTGKLIFGFTDTSAKNSSLNQLYNQPTYLRKYVTNSSVVNGIIFDFSEYSTSIGGPVYLSLLTETEEKRFYTIANNFSLSTDYTFSFSVQRTNSDNAFHLKPFFTLSGGSLNELSLSLDDILTEPLDTQSLTFGFYPFISLIGNGNATVSYSVFRGTYNHGLSYQKDKTYFSLLSSENPDYTSQYGKNVIAQNTYGITTSAFPQIDTYFSNNSIKQFKYENVTFTVKAASTSPVGLYGQTYIDGVYLDLCDYVLVAGQVDKTTNGVYQVQSQRWVKQSALPSGSNLSEPTVLVSQGNIFENTLWMLDKTSSEWISNVISCPVVIEDNNLLFTGVSSSYKYPQYIKLACSVNGIASQSTSNQVQIKLANSPTGIIQETDQITQWVGLLQNGQLYNIQEKSNSNNTVFMNFGISSSQISGITTNSFPAVYNILTSYAGNFAPAISNNSDFVLPAYGSEYRIFKNASLIYQLFSTYDSVSLSSLSTAVVNSSVYALNFANLKSPQSGYSTDIYIDNVAPTVGIVSVLSDQTKSVTLGVSSALDAGSGLYIARIVQRNPSNELIYGSWFGFNTNSFYGLSTFTAYPSYVSNVNGISTGEPLSGYYRYSLQVADSVGNVAQTNQVESFYYESALVDTQGPGCSVQFVNSQTFEPISISSSTILTAQMFATDTLSQVKAFRYRILPDGEFGNWIDYNEYANIYLPENILDGTLSVQFQFKDFGNNVLYSNSTIINDQVYVYSWNIVSKLINNTLFTVTEVTKYNNNSVLLIGASKQNSATLFVWDNNKLIELQYSGFTGCKAVTALIKVGTQVLIGTDNGSIFTYRNGVVAGPFATLSWGDTPLPISKFEIHSYPEDNTSFVYATTLNIPRIFRTPTDSLRSTSWEVVQPPFISLEKINVLNSGLWSGTQISYTISSSYIPATLSPNYSYGISSVIVASSGSNLPSAPTINVGGAITNLGLQPVMQGSIGQIILIASGQGYSSGATVTIASPATGGSSVQATGVAVTNSLGQIVSVVLTAPGYGYTAQYPAVTITGNFGNGSQATATAITQFDSIYSVTVTSTGIATTSNITLTTSGGAVLIPTFLYRVPSITLTSPGFGYTSSPIVSINGLTTLASSVAQYGSIQSITVSEPDVEFPITLSPNISLIGGASTSFTASLSTTSISFSTGSTNSFLGFVLSSVSITTSSIGFGTIPQIVFAGTGTTNIFLPQLEYVLSDDILLYTKSGSIYDIKSFDNKLFVSSSSGDIVEIGYSSGIFSAERHRLNVNSNTFSNIIPVNLAKYNDGISTNLYFSTKEEPYIGKLTKNLNSFIFDSYRDNILLFKPFNFDILSNWQLKKIINDNGFANVSYGDSNNSSVDITTFNAQAFYETTKENTWFNRCITNNDYLVLFDFQAVIGTQSFEISTFNSTLKVAFTVLNNTLQIAFGNNNYSTIEIDLSPNYNIYFAKSSQNLYIYNDYNLIYSETGFFVTASSQPVIKFGYIFEPQIVSANGDTLNIFGLPSSAESSQFIWRQIKFSFNSSTNVLPTSYYSLSLPYVMANSSSVRALRNINDSLFAATKSISDRRSTTNLPDVGTKVFRLDNDYWTDVTGNFDTYTASVSTSYVITSPNDINALDNSYFVTGLVKSTPTRQASNVIILGLTSNVIYEEQSGVILTIIYPYNIEPSGQFLTLTSNNNLISSANTIFFNSNEQVKTVSLGVGSTSLITNATLTVTDGNISSTASLNILPIGISTFGFNTSSFVGFSQDSVIANIRLTSIPKTNRAITLSSNNSSVLSALNNGIATVLAGNIGIFTSLSIGTAVNTNTTVTVSASYRSSFGISTIVAVPFFLTLGINTNYFVGNESTRKIFATSSVQKSPIGVLTVNYTSSNSSVLSIQPSGIISPSSFSTSTQLSIGNAVTTNTQINVTGKLIGTISTGISTAAPFVVVSATTDLSNPVLGLQTANVTFTINTTPLTNVSVRNIISSPTFVNMVFPTFSTVLAGTLSTTFAISTTVQTSAGLGITAQGAPFGFNTSPVPGLIMTSDVWKITGMSVSPTSIVGNGLFANGIGQSYIVSVTLNVGLTTTVLITSSTGFVSTRNINFLSTSNGSASSIGYATGFSTSAITNVTLTATGPNSISSSISGLFLNPILISSFATSYVWNNIATLSPNYLVGGLGATAIGIITLNSYVATGVQTVLIRTGNATTPVFIQGQSASSNILGLATVQTGSNTTSINFGASFVSLNTTETITARIISSGGGVATSPLNVYTYPDYNAIFYPVYSRFDNNVSVSVASSLPVNVGLAITFDNGVSGIATLPALQNSVQTSFNLGIFKTDKTFVANTVMLGTLQTYYVTGFGNTGQVFGMGYNYYGELSYNYPVLGPTNGSPEKIYMGLENVVKTAAGYHHVLALDYFGNLYGIGYNAYNQLNSTGISTNAFVQLDTKNNYVRDIIADGNSSYFISADNKLFGFGQNSSNIFGTSGFASTSVPYLIASNVQLAEIYSNRGTYVAYSNKMGIQTVYEFGGNSLGITSKPITNLTDQGVLIPIANLRITGIDVAQTHTVAAGIWSNTSLGISSNGVFAWGSNDYYQLGTSSSTGYITTPNIIHKFTTSGVDHITQSEFVFAENRISGIVESYIPQNQYFVSSVVVNTQGIGYTAGATVTFSAPPVSAISSTAAGYAVTNTLGIVSSVLITNQGAGYNLGAAVTFSPPPAGINTRTATGSVIVSANKVDAITITDAGNGYIDAPAVFITPIAGGSGAAGISSLAYSQITQIVLTSAGFGYTNAPTVTISAPVGAGATATAIIESSASPANIVYQVGASVTSNATGIGLLQTSIATPVSITIPQVLQKISKNSQHFLWTMKSGNIYVSGGSIGPVPLTQLTTIFTQTINLFGQNQFLGSNELYSYVYTTGAIVTVSLFAGALVQNVSSVPVKLTMMPVWGSYSNNEWGWALTLKSDGSIDYFRQSPTIVPKYVQNYLKNVYGNTFVDVSATAYFKPTRSYGDSNYSPVALAYSGGNIFVIRTQGATSYNVYLSKASAVAPVIIESGYISYQYNSLRTFANFIVGYANGNVELYVQTLFGFSHSLLSTWNLDGSQISVIKSLINATPMTISNVNSSSSNFVYLYIGTQNRMLKSYYAWNSNFSTLGGSETPTQIGSVTLNSVYGYAKLIESFSDGLIYVATSNNYLLVMSATSLIIYGATLVPGTITSITSCEGNQTGVAPSSTPTIFVTTTFNVYAYEINIVPNYEIGLDFYNISGDYQILTQSGLQTGIAVTNVVSASTNDTFSIILKRVDDY
jgi:hypothetical protein